MQDAINAHKFIHNVSLYSTHENYIREGYCDENVCGISCLQITYAYGTDKSGKFGIRCIHFFLHINLFNFALLGSVLHVE